MLGKIPDDVRLESRVLTESDRWQVGSPLSFRAMGWWGGFTEWCTAHDISYFNDYSAKGALVIFWARETNYRWMLHPATREFRNHRNHRASWRDFLMQHVDIVDALLPTTGEQPNETVSR